MAAGLNAVLAFEGGPLVEESQDILRGIVARFLNPGNPGSVTFPLTEMEVMQVMMALGPRTQTQVDAMWAEIFAPIDTACG